MYEQHEGHGDRASAEGALAELRAQLTHGLARARLTKTQLAAQTGLGRTTVQQAFRGMTVPSPETVVALCKVLRIPDGGLLELQRAAAETQKVPGPHDLGRSITAWHPHELEVHPAGSLPGLSASSSPPLALPAYVRREHDTVLSGAIENVKNGRSQLLILVGTSSTGKTRSCWEAVRPLADQGWRLWHPFDPTRADAALDDLPRVGRQTVLWLNEAQHYFGHPIHGERIAAAVHRLLTEPERGPVLVLGTLWPEYVDRYLALPSAGGADPHSRVRELLAGRLVTVPDSFNASALQAAEILAENGDRLLADALTRTRTSGKLTQELAGVPELLRRYTHAAPAAKALLNAAMDARRLGAGLFLPQAFLTDAALDYLSEDAYDQLTEDWEAAAYADLSRPVHGKQTPLRRAATRPTRHPPGTPPPEPRKSATAGPAYRIADYLEQLGSRSRQALCPPSSFWAAAHTHLVDADGLYRLASEARSRHRTQWAHHLCLRAAELGNPEAQAELAETLEENGLFTEAEVWAHKAAGSGRHRGLNALCRMRETRGEHASAEDLALQAAAAGDVTAALHLIHLRERPESEVSAEELVRHLAEAGHVQALTEGARLREEAGDHRTAWNLYLAAAKAGAPTALNWLGHAARARKRPDLAENFYLRAAEAGDDYALYYLLRLAADNGETNAAANILQQAAETDDPATLVALIDFCEAAGDKKRAETLARKAAGLGHHRLLADLGRDREKDGDFTTSETLYREAFAAGDPEGLADVVKLRVSRGDYAEAEDVAMQCAEHGNTEPLCRLVSFWRHVGDRERAETLAHRAVGAGHYDAIVELAWQYQQSGENAAAITCYEEASEAEHADALAELALMRERAGSTEEAEILAVRAAEAGRPDALSELVSARENGGSPSSAEELARRAAASGHPEVLIELAETREENSPRRGAEHLYLQAADAAGAPDAVLTAIWPYGLDPDGTPAQPWAINVSMQNETESPVQDSE
ncbi:helix-turn-helix domain-containing protein [Streptomyces sp. NPDC059618]|uniref:helix-turn-helix domain-containing protein n=1 Tax=Streptomyces sp. NPDC059618 TaxID=3346887 RepID=UPI0036AC1927